MKNKIIPIFFILFFILSISCIADKITINVEKSEQGLNIEQPQTIFYENNNDFDLVFKIFNSTGSIETTSSCNLTLLDFNGNILKSKEALTFNSSSETYTSTVTEGDTNGLYSYYVYCEGSVEDGFLSSGFYISPDGYELRIVGEFDYLIIILIFMFIAFMSFKISEMFVSKEFFGLKIIFFIWGVLQVILVLPIFLLTLSSYGSPTAMFEWFIVYFTIDIFLLIIFTLGYWLVVGGHIILFFTKIAKRKKPKQIKYQ
jgi:hypothetical protein